VVRPRRRRTRPRICGARVLCAKRLGGRAGLLFATKTGRDRPLYGRDGSIARGFGRADGLSRAKPPGSECAGNPAHRRLLPAPPRFRRNDPRGSAAADCRTVARRPSRAFQGQDQLQDAGWWGVRTASGSAGRLVGLRAAVRHGNGLDRCGDHRKWVPGDCHLSAADGADRTGVGAAYAYGDERLRPRAGANLARRRAVLRQLCTPRVQTEPKRRPEAHPLFDL